VKVIFSFLSGPNLFVYLAAKLVAELVSELSSIALPHARMKTRDEKWKGEPRQAQTFAASIVPLFPASFSIVLQPALPRTMRFAIERARHS